MASSSSSSAEANLATAKTVLSAVASVAATAMLARSIAQDLLPHEFRDYFFSGISSFFSRFSNQLTMVIDEFDALVSNQIYESAEVYLGSKVSPMTHRLKVSKREKDKSFTITMESNEEIVDFFNGVKFKWVLVSRQVESKDFYNPRDLNSTLRSQVRCFELSFHKKHLDMVLDSYLPHILDEAKSIKQDKKTIKIFTMDPNNLYCNLADAWTPTNLDHPATFETLALDSEIKNFILKDLNRFIKRKEYYRKVGKAWKRGYLLYGPPGTGKSSLIAAMANYLNFDIYDLDLTGLRADSELRRLLISMANRSILVVEDIDCTIEFQDRMAESNRENGSPNNQVTLSGLLNFIDGLWSSCGDERIIIFTTNHKEKLDPALLRPGRMDVHVNMSYCTPTGFRLLAANYLGIKEHSLFEAIEKQIEITEVTPAEVAEQLIQCDESDNALQGLIEFLKVKKKENEEAKVKKKQEELEAKEKEKETAAKEAETKKKDEKPDGDEKKMPSPSSLFSAYASMAASMMLFRSMANELVPQPVRGYLHSTLHYIFKIHSAMLTLVIEESNNISRNQLYDAAEVYLCTKISLKTDRLKISKTPKAKNITIRLEKGEKLVDVYEGIVLQWRFVCAESRQNNPSDPFSPPRSEKRFFELKFHKKHKEKVLESYVHHVLEKAKEIKDEERVLKMYTLNNSGHHHPYNGFKWDSINLEHPSTFETLAMDLELKNTVIEDLNRFVKRKEFYMKVGRAWKRGYLLYGPPGTGKSSLVAAMANYLKFDVYDLQLANILRDSDLRKLLLATANRSILVIEDIDCSVDLPDRIRHGDGRKQVPDVQLTLSGLLNFIDGLWSSCGDERIIIFTTNHKERLDPALLRPGRMDMHIHMSYCTYHGFQLLASNYLDIQNHHYLYDEIEGLLKETEVTPAQVAEELMKSEEVDVALEGLVKLLKRKKMEGDECEVENENKIGAKGARRQKTENKLKKPVRNSRKNTTKRCSNRLSAKANHYA
ncbi:hypothetical protein ACLB2K_005762 [Fragaria x ananassa]